MTEEEMKREYEKEKELFEEYTKEKVAFERQDPLGAIAESSQFSPDFVPGIPSGEQLATAAASTDILESPIRAGVSEFAKGKFITGSIPEKASLVGSSLKAAGNQLVENIKDPLLAPSKAPNYSEIIDREMRSNTIPNLLTSESEKKAVSGVGGIGLEMAMPSATYGAGKALTKVPSIGGKVSEFLSKSKTALKSAERNQLAKVMAKFETQAQFKNSKIDPDQVAAHLVDGEVGKYANNPRRMLEELTGEKRTNYVEVSPGLSKETKDFKEGLIGKKSKAMKAEIIDIANKNGVETQVPAFALKNKLRQKSLLQDPLSGRRFSPEDMEKRSQLVDEILKPLEEEIVPGVPLEAVMENPRLTTPPVVPLEQPDLFPLSRMEKSVTPPNYPPRPEFEGIDIPQILRPPEDINRMGGLPITPRRFSIKKTTLPPPKPPQSYGGVVSKEVQDKYAKDMAQWEASVKLEEANYLKQLEEADYLDSMQLSAAEKTRESLSREAISKYDSAIKEWELEVDKLKKEYEVEKAKGKKYDDMVMQAKVEQAAKRFEEKAKRNQAYKKEIIDADENYRQTLIESLNKKVFNKPRHWSLQDMMELRTNIGKRLSSAEFHSDKPLTMEKEVLEEIYHNLREEITDSIKGLPTNVKGVGGRTLDAAEYYDIQSNAVRRMIEGSEVLKGAILNEYKNPDAIANAMAILSGAGVAGGVGLATTMAGGDVSLPITLLGTMGAGAAYTNMKKGTPQLMTRGIRGVRKGLEFSEQNPQVPIKLYNMTTRGIRDNMLPPEENYREPQSMRKYPSMGSDEMTPMEVAKARLPRTTEGLIQNKELVIAKLAVNGVPPNMINTITQALNEEPESVQTLAPMIMSQFPTLFEKSKYNMFDGKIVDPAERAKAADDISKRDDLTSIQRAKIISELNKTGKYLGE